jgi:hypothetical protein
MHPVPAINSQFDKIGTAGYNNIIISKEGRSGGRWTISARDISNLLHIAKRDFTRYMLENKSHRKHRTQMRPSKGSLKLQRGCGMTASQLMGISGAFSVTECTILVKATVNTTREC